MGERFTSATDTYEVDAPFAEGASGLAYRALSTKLGKRCFLKQLKLAGTRDWKTVELFEREARVLAGLEHPAIPRYLDYFHDPERGCFILVQELIDAPSLQDLLNQQHLLTPAALQAIVEQGLEVLDYLHTRVPPVLHRDISPKNFLFAAGRLSLVDFGAVKLSLRDSTMMTSAGTFGYMAPEHIMGQALPASDLYGLGMVVIALATHHDPSDLPLDASHGGVDLSQVLPRIPGPLRALVESLVKPGLAQRVPSASAALELLRAPAPPPPLPATPAGPSRLATTFTALRRHPLRNGLYALALLFCLTRLMASVLPFTGQSGQLGGWTGGHTRFLAQLTGTLVGDYDLLVSPHDIDALAFSPDGSLVASAAGERVLIWDRERGKLMHDLAVPRNGAGWLRFSASGATLWAGLKYGTTLVRWNTATGAIEETLDLEMLPIAQGVASEILDFTGDDERRLSVLVQSTATDLTLFQRESDAITPITLQDRGVDARLSADARILAVMRDRPGDDNDQTGTVLVRRIKTGEELGRFSLRYLETLALAPDGQTVALISSRGVALHRLGETDSPQILLFGLGNYSYGLRARFSADGSRLVVAVGEQIVVIDVTQRRVLGQFSYKKTALDSMPVSALAINHDGTLIASGNHDEVTRLWPVP